ncbi:MAG: hypothetical protein FWG37_06405 [Clostridia bacterium]|nr:hypothetical protein [Clostridia bacterium]
MIVLKPLGKERKARQISTKVKKMRNDLFSWGMVGLYAVFNVAGAGLMNYIVKAAKSRDLASWQGILAFFLEVFHPLLIFGMGLVFCSSLIWMVSLKGLELSRAYPVAISLTTFGTLAVAFIIFREPIVWQKIAGAVIIVCGIALVASA